MRFSTVVFQISVATWCGAGRTGRFWFRVAAMNCPVVGSSFARSSSSRWNGAFSMTALKYQIAISTRTTVETAKVFDFNTSFIVIGVPCPEALTHPVGDFQELPDIQSALARQITVDHVMHPSGTR